MAGQNKRDNYGSPFTPDFDLRYVSVSSIEKFEGAHGSCNTRWFLRYIKKIPEPQTTNQEAGERAHFQIDFYLKNNSDVLGPNLKPYQYLLPAPGKDLFVEEPLSPIPATPTSPIVSLVKADGVPLVGKIDWINPRGVYVAPESTENKIILAEDPPGTVEVGDNKTTSKIKYAKTESELAASIQMNGYGVEASLRFPQAKFIRLSHVVFQMGKAKAAKKTTILRPLTSVLEAWETGGNQTVRKMKLVAKLKNHEEVLKNTDSCTSYGRPCPYLKICFPNPIARMQAKSSLPSLNRVPKSKQSKLEAVQSPQEGTRMSLLSKVRAKTVESNGATANPLPAPPPPVQVKAPVVPPPPSATPVSPPPPAQAPVLRRKLVIHEQDPLLADAPASPTTLEIPPPKAPTPSVVTSTPPPPTLGTSSTPEPTEEAPKRRGRPMGSKNKKTLEKEAQEDAPRWTPGEKEAAQARVDARETDQVPSEQTELGLDEAQAEIDAQVAEEEAHAAQRAADRMADELLAKEEFKARERAKYDRAKEAEANRIQSVPQEGPSNVHLFINAIPPGKFTSLDYYIRAVVRQVEEQFPDCPDIRCPPKADHALGFGRWKGALAAMVRAQPPQPGTYVVFTRGSEFAEVVSEALVPLASVTRGV